MASRKLAVVPNCKEFHLYLERFGIQGILRQITKEILERPSRASNVFVYVERRIRELGEERHERLLQERQRRRRLEYPVGMSNVKHSLPVLAFGTKVTDPEALEIFEKKRRYRGPLIIRYQKRSPAVKLGKFLNSEQPRQQSKTQYSNRRLHSRPIDGGKEEDEYESDFEADLDHMQPTVTSESQSKSAKRDQAIANKVNQPGSSFSEISNHQLPTLNVSKKEERYSAEPVVSQGIFSNSTSMPNMPAVSELSMKRDTDKEIDKTLEMFLERSTIKGGNLQRKK